MLDGAYVLAGALTGGVVGLTGVGGGALMTPVLLIFFGVAPATAVATDLWFAAITKVFGAGAHHSAGNVDWQVARRLWLGSIPAALAAMAWAHGGHAFARLDGLSRLIGVAVLLTSLGLVLAPWLARRLENGWSGRPARRPARAQAALTVLAGALVGVCVSLTSVGAGALGSLALLCLYPLRMHSHRLVATDIVHAIPLALVAGTGYLLAGMVDWSMLLSLLVGSVPAVLVGSRAAAKLPPRLLQLCLASVLLVVGLKVIV